jgi:PAS domain S-box-containing protein
VKENDIMPNHLQEPSHPDTLRQRAETLLARTPPQAQAASGADLQQVLHELLVYQTELELQNAELSRSQEALQIARDQYMALYDCAPVGYLTLDAQGMILEANLTAATMLGVNRSALLQTPLTRFIVRDDQDCFYLYRRRVLEVDTLETCDLHLQRLDGTTWVAHLESRAGSDMAADPHTWHTTLSDITARKRAEEALQAAHDTLEQRVLERTAALSAANARLAQEMTERQQLEAQIVQAQKMEALGTLAGGIAHSFNNLLAAILGFSQLLQNEVAPESRAAAYLHAVRTAGLQAKELVQHILTFSRRDASVRSPVELRLLIHETLRLLRAVLPATIDLRVQLNAHGGLVLANPTELQQVLINVASNAADAMRASGGILEIVLDHEAVTPAMAARHPALRPGPYLRVTMRDTGVGMDPEVLERIFEPFFTTKPVGEGTGMGLAIAHGVVSSHGGAMLAESRPGQGTTLTIYLPRLPDAPASASLPAAPLPRGQERLLVVEDDEALARLAQTQLTELGYTVHVCTSSVEALTLFQADPQAFDLVLTDQTMPHMTGNVLTQKLRRLRPELPIILVTGYNPLMDAATARALGIDAFLLKPFEIHELAQIIRQVLEQRWQPQGETARDT